MLVGRCRRRDLFGDTALNANTDFTIRHNAVLDPWVAALKRAFRGQVETTHAAVRVADGIYADGRVRNGLGTGRHIYLECKVKSSLTSEGMPTHGDATQAAFAALQGTVADIHNKYAAHISRMSDMDDRLQHEVVPLIHDTFGAVHWDATSLLKDADRRMRGRAGFDADPSDPNSCDASLHWSAPSYKSRAMQTISIALHTALAEHVHRYIQQRTPA